MAAKRDLVLMCLVILCSISTIDIVSSLTPEQEMDRITALPGQPPVKFNQFSGYVTVNESHGRALFYWLTEATDNAEKKPLVLWLNGGPGCSSIAFGASEEIGPFRINPNASSLYLNDYSWNKVANILFLESPAGVGFSYTNRSSDLYDTGDESTAQDALLFLMRWSKRFPQYNNRDFYIAGESYGGHYIPQLAKKIVASDLIINFKGFIVGNGQLDYYSDSFGTVTYWWSHSIISENTYNTFIKYCNFTKNSSKEFDEKKCGEIWAYANNHEFGNIDHYSIYTASCLTSPRTSEPNKHMRFKNTTLSRKISGYDPCTENYAEKYYNRPDVQKALHANTTRIPYNWTACNDVLFKNWTDSPDSVLPIYKELMAAGLRIWIFSGDTDSVIPVTATRFSLKELNLKVKTPWYPWYLDRQVGGWTEVYEGLTFATVRGAGHEVPKIQPERAFLLFQSFLSGNKLPKS